MFKTLRNAWSIPEMRQKLIYTLFILLLYRIGAAVHVPFTNVEYISQYFDLSGGNLFAYLNILSGDAFSKATLFALSISPYITASIVMQLLAIAIPALERLSKSGEEGQKKITQITRIVTVALAFLTAFGYYLYMKNSTGFLTSTGNTVFGGFVIVFCYAAGASLIMWLAEKINEKGIGNGISIILFANIIATVVAQATSLVTYAMESSWNLVIIELVVFGALAMITFVVFVTNSERRLPVQYAKKVVGRKMYGGQSTTLPIKLNMSGVMPIIFANSIVAIPSTIEMIVQTKIKKGGFWDKFFDVFAYDSWVYAILFFILIILFSYFYILISFNPVEVANNLKKNGGFIPGIRPGKPTSDYITRVLNRITLIGALFLGVIAVVPLIVNICTGSQIGSLAFGGSSLLIVVGVILETVREIEAQMTMRHYKGFLE
ncbi:MAG: preprotein translocase subunit SecY [Clostridia bacterium]|nr:preprotein translocase subunit SecY [Clostridia bacterium]